MKKILVLMLITACKSSGFRGDDEQKPAAPPSPAPTVQAPVNPSAIPTPAGLSAAPAPAQPAAGH